MAADDHFDSVLALSLKTGTVKWAHKTVNYDASTLACVLTPPAKWCPSPSGPDYDFGSGPNLFTARSPATGKPETLVGIGQKSGIYWALNPVNGHVVWSVRTGPGSRSGGSLWGSATDGTRIYVQEGNASHISFVLKGGGPEAGKTCTGGAWSALSPATGQILWQVCDPHGNADTGALSVADGVVYAGSMAKTAGVASMYALNAATGAILWSFATGGEVNSGPAIVAGTVYWGSGYGTFGVGPADKNLYAFTVGTALSFLGG
jgi:polyvinyl alcohol dehydrogenase (cytochrome)